MQRRTVSPSRGLGGGRGTAGAREGTSGLAVAGRGRGGNINTNNININNINTTRTSTTLTRPGLTRPSAVVRELHKNDGTNPQSVRGRQIASAMNDLMEDVYGDETIQWNTPPPISSSSSTGVNTGDHSYARFKTSFTNSAISQSWQTGPIDTAGRCFNASDRNLLCMDVHLNSNLCVVGSADHGLKVFDIKTGKEKRNLYTKKYGHTEWVTCCRYFQDNGKIISGGMDSKLCLWESTGPVRCTDLLGHTGSISQVEVNNNSGIAISSSYDRTLRIWDCNNINYKPLATLAGHKAPVMMLAWCGTQLLSGDRQGVVKAWDLATGSCLATLSVNNINNNNNKGQVGALAHVLNPHCGLLGAIGDQSGALTIIDIPRTGSRPIYQNILHPGGVLSGIRGVDYRPLLVTAGADKVINTLDPRASFARVGHYTEHQDYIYSLETFGSLVLSGGGNGWLLVHDTNNNKCCYGLGANSAAVREICATPSHLVAAGDDGNAIVYDFI